jgi:decaprenylphosphoryl-5-phosphoribose phosphatase
MARFRRLAQPDATGRLAALDLAGLRLARTVGHTPAAEQAARVLSRIGEHGAGWIALGLVGARLARGESIPADSVTFAGGACGDAFPPRPSGSPRRARFLRAALTVAAAYGANQAVKRVVRRPRPELPDLPPLISTPGRLSFPSAHAATSMAAVRVFDGLLPRVPLRAAAMAIVASRLYLGVHYPSDIVAGVALGDLVGRIGRASRP